MMKIVKLIYFNLDALNVMTDMSLLIMSALFQANCNAVNVDQVVAHALIIRAIS